MMEVVGETSPRVAAVGMFDGLHRGHRYLLGRLKEEAINRGGEAVVVTFSNHPLEVVAPDRAPRLLSLPEEKRALLAAAGIGETVMVEFDRDMMMTSSRGFLENLRQRYGITALLLGFNNRFGHDRIDDFGQYRQIGREAGVELVAADEFTAEGVKVSSSAVRALLGKGDVSGAAQMLGRPYSLEGVVVHGRQLGRTIGFPTANIEVADPARKLLPAPGVYASRVLTAAGVECISMVNIGHRPTVDTPDAPLSVEVNLIDYDREHVGTGFTPDLYGTELRLEFIEQLRSERRFPSVEELAAQLGRDRDRARESCVAFAEREKEMPYRQCR